jgi:hypothetical protein
VEHHNHLDPINQSVATSGQQNVRRWHLKRTWMRGEIISAEVCPSHQSLQRGMHSPNVATHVCTSA